VKRVHKIGCLALVGNGHVEDYIWSLRLYVRYSERCR
jgi:hypothetical protein